MRKKETVIIYPNLCKFSNFCDEYAKSLKIGKNIKKFILFYIIIIVVSIFINCIFFLLRTSWVYSLIINIFLMIISICNYLFFLRLLRKKEMFLDLYDCFIRLISDEEYSCFDSLTSLNELSFYIKNIKNQKNVGVIFSMDRLKKWPLITTILPIFINNGVLFFLKNVFKDKISLVLVILFIILLFSYGLKELLSLLFGNNYQRLCNSLLLSCIVERRNEIINSSRDNLVSKLQYMFRIGKYH